MGTGSGGRNNYPVMQLCPRINILSAWGKRSGALHDGSISSACWIPAALGSLPWTIQLVSAEVKFRSRAQIIAASATHSSR